MRSLCLSALLLAFSAVHAGTVLETTRRELKPDGKSSTTSTYAQGGAMRVEGSDSVMIFKDDAIYLLRPRDKSYAVMDRASMQRMADQMNPQLKQMQEQLAKLPPEQRAEMEKMMAQRMPGFGKQKTQEFRKTARKEKVVGYACSYVEILADGVLTDEVCVTPTASIKGSGELLNSSQKMSALVREMMSTLDAPWLRQMTERQIAQYDKLGGVPVLTRHFMDGKASHETTIKSVRTEALPAATFEVPADYAKKELTARP